MNISGIPSLGGASYTTGAAVDKEVERVSDAIAKEFADLMKKIQDITSKDPKSLTPDDIYALRNALKALDALQQVGLTPAMTAARKLVAGILEQVGIKPNDVGEISKEKLKELQDKMKEVLAEIPIEGKKVSFAEIIKLILDPTQRASDTKSIGDMLLDLMTKRSADYDAKLKELKDQLDFAKKLLDQLNDIQKIFELIVVKMPEGFKFPPTSMDDIPVALRDKLKQELGDPLTWDKVTKWLENGANKGKYINWASDYFKQDLKIEIDLTSPEALQKLTQMLKTRDNLIKEIEELKKTGGSEDKIAALDKLIKDIDKIFPQKNFPPNSDWDKLFTRPGPDKPEERKKWDETMGNYLHSEYITNWFREGFKGNSDTINNITNAMNVFKEFSGKLTDKLKELNQKFDQFADLCTKIMQELNKIMLGFARRPGQ